MVKNYLIDTNILLQNPQSIFGFDDNNLWISGTTLQELDSKKSAPGDVGYNARETCRILDELRLQGNFLEGIKLKNGGTLYVEPDGISAELLPDGYSLNVPDNRIISCGLSLKKGKCKDAPVILLTNDISMRINASVCGLDVEEVRNEIVQETGYTGHMELYDVDPTLITDLYREGAVAFAHEDLFENEFVTLHSGTMSALSIYRKGLLKVVREQTLFGGVKPLNKMQTYAMYALMAPVEEIPLVILMGPAGTAKTFLSLAAGLSQTYFRVGRRTDERYEKILISRPISELRDESLGALPGDVNDKLGPHLSNYFDNIEHLFRNKDKGDEGSIEEAKTQVEDLMASGALEICPLAYIRGRSIMNSYIICDEAQNASKTLVRDVVSRAAKNSKVILAGDIQQCDRLDPRTNGLVYAAEGMKGSTQAAFIKFTEDQCVRSALAEEAIRRLK